MMVKHSRSDGSASCGTFSGVFRTFSRLLASRYGMWLVLFVLLCPGRLAASPLYVSYSGNFVSDDDHANAFFTTAGPATVTLRSWSYAGGTDELSNVVAAGGFAPVLSLFDPTGNLLAFDRGGTVGGVAPFDCQTGNRAIDAASGFCLDAYQVAFLVLPGTYQVVLTEQDNLPNGPTLSDGFNLDGTGNFTGGPFWDPGGNPRTSAYRFTIGVDEGPTSVPEPSAAPLIAAGFLWLVRRNRG